MNIRTDPNPGGGSRGGGRRETADLAPSWSWASIDGEVLTFGRPEAGGEPVSLIDDTSYTIEHETDDRFGRVRSASLTFRGRLYAATLKLYPNRGPGWAVARWSRALRS